MYRASVYERLISSSYTSFAAMAKSSAKYTLIPNADETEALKAPDIPGDDSDEADAEGKNAGSTAGRERGEGSGIFHRRWTRASSRPPRGVENLILNYLSVKTAAVYILTTRPASLVPAFSSLPAPSHSV
jgi:hypothetical protein